MAIGMNNLEVALEQPNRTTVCIYHDLKTQDDVQSNRWHIQTFT